MSYRLSIGRSATAASLLLLWATPAFADVSFGVQSLDDAALSEIRGAYQPSDFSPKASQLTRLQDDASRNDFRFFGNAVSVIMDNWWAEQGAALFARNGATPR